MNKVKIKAYSPQVIKLIGKITMNPERLVFNDTPVFIPVSEALHHHRVEVILWPLDKDNAPVVAPTPTWTDFFNRYTRQVNDATPCAREELYAEQTNCKGVTQ
jgi:hypothetical protein